MKKGVKKKLNLLDILAWIALVSIVIWVLLKIIGVLNTLLYIEYYPVLDVSYVIGWQMHKLSSVADDVKGLKRFKNETVSEINDIKTNCKSNYR